MPNNIAITLLTTSQVLRPGTASHDPSDFSYRFLAQGDSWFSIGALPPWSTANLLMQLQFEHSACAVNCAHPGDTLAHMVNWIDDPEFVALLSGVQAVQWHGIFLSAGGNDLSSAINVTPTDEQGALRPQQQRLLLTPAEWGAGSGPTRYLSQEGWALFCTHMAAQFAALIALRDRSGSPNKGAPIFFHTYDYPTPRNAPASALPRLGSWLYPAFIAYQIPSTDWIAVSCCLIDRLADFLSSLADKEPTLVLIDTRKILEPAALGSSGANGDWENEIHPVPDGYSKLAAQWVDKIQAHVKP